MAEQTEKVMQEIRRYLDGHPHATDAIGGVHDFWLSGAGASVSWEVLGAALERLTGTGAIEARRVAGGQVIYSAARGGPSMSVSVASSERVRVQNLTRRPLVFSLNSRTTMRLSPSAVSGEVDGWELHDNPHVTKLVGRNAIRLLRSAAREEDRPARRKDERRPGRS
jgi:hypothetical protein